MEKVFYQAGAKVVVAMIAAMTSRQKFTFGFPGWQNLVTMMTLVQYRYNP